MYTMSLSEIDKKILQRLQTNLPLTHRPFLDLAKELELDEDLVIERVKAMIDGKIRTSSCSYHKHPGRWELCKRLRRCRFRMIELMT